MMFRIVLVACLILSSCSSESAPPVAIASASEVADPFVFELVTEHGKAAQADPMDGELRGTLGMVYESNHMWAWAAKAYANAAELDPDNPHWGYHASVANYQNGQAEAGDHFVEAAVQRFPDFGPARLRFGLALMNRGEVEGALEQFDHLTRLAPKFAEGWVSSAEALVLLEREELALERVQVALGLEPDFLRAKYIRGLALQGLGRLTEAESDLAIGAASGRALMPDGITARLATYATGVSVTLTRAMSLMKSKRYSKALEMAEASLKLRPDNVRLLNLQALAYRNLKNPRRAIEILTRARQLDPGDYGTVATMAGSYFDLKDMPRSLEAAQAARRIAPENGMAHFLEGRALVATGKMTEASKALRTALRLTPDLSQAHLYLAESLTAVGRFAEAEPNWKIASERSPDYAPAIFNLGMIQLDLLKPEEARETLKRLTALGVRSPGAKDLEGKLAEALRAMTGK